MVGGCSSSSERTSSPATRWKAAGIHGWTSYFELSTMGIVFGGRAGRLARAPQEASAPKQWQTVDRGSGTWPGLVDRFTTTLARVRPVLPVDISVCFCRHHFIRPWIYCAPHGPRQSASLLCGTPIGRTLPVDVLADLSAVGKACVRREKSCLDRAIVTSVFDNVRY